jgi:hypothetical protein
MRVAVKTINFVQSKKRSISKYLDTLTGVQDDCMADVICSQKASRLIYSLNMVKDDDELSHDDSVCRGHVFNLIERQINIDLACQRP